MNRQREDVALDVGLIAGMIVGILVSSLSPEIARILGTDSSEVNRIAFVGVTCPYLAGVSFWLMKRTSHASLRNVFGGLFLLSFVGNIANLAISISLHSPYGIMPTIAFCSILAVLGIYVSNVGYRFATYLST